ncbi:aspartate--ammonia ligase [Nephila pilipes]|uniref:Aspartate--ammonia ligase n=1 Tax=Nephila pilipes TaxID=299642 RepID=A0A8X6QH72_NEPPI|nr:aspartate--ammonia ligase [Nephila pilipes]
MFVETESGINDDLNGYERPVTFDLKCGISASVVQSLAKWKRLALMMYKFEVYEGLYANMNAIRRDEDVGKTKSEESTGSRLEYDDWGFECIFWFIMKELHTALELSSMESGVKTKILIKQLGYEASNRLVTFHKCLRQ